MGARGAELLAPGVAGGAGGPAPFERARPPRTLPCPLSEAAGAVDGEGAPPGGAGALAAAMRVNEKYSTLPAEDRSVHIINICAIEDLGYQPSEGTVSAGAATGGRAAHLRRARGGQHGAPGLAGLGVRGVRAGRPPVHVGRGCRRAHSLRSAGPERNASPPLPTPRATRRPSLGPDSASLLPRVSAESLLPRAPGPEPKPGPWVGLALPIGVGWGRQGGGGGATSLEEGGSFQAPQHRPSGGSCAPLASDPPASPSPAPGARSSQGARPERELPTPGAAGGL